MYFEGRAQPAVTHSNAHEASTANIFIMVTDNQSPCSAFLMMVRFVSLKSDPVPLHSAHRHVTSLLTSTSRD